MKLWLARHAAPLIDSGICYGSLDVEADEAATQSSARALAASAAWKSGITNRGSVAFTSTSQRCDANIASTAA